MKPLTLLIVDDTAWNRRLLRAQLEAEGHAVLEAADGIEALAALERAPVDVVISDLLMPRMDGFALCRAIRQQARLQTLPLLVFTSTYNSQADEQMAYQMGADKYLSKPAPADVLARTVDELASDARYRQPRAVQPPPEAVVLREYNATLVRKLEEKHQDLERAHAELEARHQALTAALAEVRQAEAQLRDSLREKELLLQEVHHRVKNNLQIVSSLLSLQQGGTQNPELIAALQDNRSRIKSMALVHEHLRVARSVAEIEFAHFTRELATHIFHAFNLPGSPVTIEFDLEPVQVGMDKAIPCALILNELVTNTLKHAFPDRRAGKLQLTLRPGPAGLACLTVRDNGVGLPPGLDFHGAETLGLRLVETLTHQIHGTLVLDRVGGTGVTLTFPPHRPERKPGV